MSERDLEEIGRQVIDSAIKVHKSLGPGLLESAYQVCLMHELKVRDINVVCEVEQPITYEGKLIEVGYRIDMLVEDKVIIENKTAADILPAHKAQLLTHIKLRGCK